MRVSNTAIRRSIGLLAWSALVGIGSRAAAQQPIHAAVEEAAPAEPTARLPLRLPLLDLPQNLYLDIRYPSWEEGLAWSVAATNAGHWLVHLGHFHWGIDYLLTAAVDGLLFFPGEVALHELGHASVLAYGGIPNHIVMWPPAQDRVNADVSFNQLDQFTRTGTNLAHQQEAGWESEIERLARVEADALFYDKPGVQVFASAFMTKFSVLYYHFGPACKIGQGTGDCLQWAYFVTRPNESLYVPYPQGTIDGLERPPALTTSQANFYKLQRGLTLLNLVDPALAFQSGFAGTDPFTGKRVRWKASVVHMLAPFGSRTSIDAFWKEGELRARAALSVYVNGATVLPGFSLGLARLPARVGSVPLALSPTASVWIQPRDQEYGTVAVTPGGMLSLEVAAPIAHALEVFVAGNAKTAGWVPIQPDLGPTANFLAGLNVLVP
jgi:hypothetical protein